MKKNVMRYLYYFIYIMMILASIFYIGWRIIYTIPFQYGMVSTSMGILLILAETLGILEGIQHFYGMGQECIPEKPEIPDSMYPHVDVFISTYNEDSDLLYKTINGCKNMAYPDKEKVHIYLCDDAHRPYMKVLSDEMGIGYITRDDHKDAKAGNLNNALKHSTSPYVVTFDADMIPLHNFLMEVVPYLFLPDMEQVDGVWRKREAEEAKKQDNIGFIQAPQSFYNPDLFQYYLYSEQKVPNEQDYFYRDVQIARNKTNSAIYGGSNTILSRAALEEIGGFYTGVITEDFATGISIQAKGYRTYAIDQILAIGLAPSDLKSLIKQRERWARGCIQTLKKVNVLTKPGLHLGQRLSYLSSLNYWYTPLRRFMYILSPILFSVFHIAVVDASLLDVLLFWLPQFLLHMLALKLFSKHIRTTQLSNVYDTILFPSLLIPVLKETLGFKQKKFAVTAKKKENNAWSYQVRQALPHGILVILSVIGIVQSSKALFLEQAFANSIIIMWLLINLCTLCLSLFFMTGRRMQRVNERSFIKESIQVQTIYHEFDAQLMDVSDSGLAFQTQIPMYISLQETITIHILSTTYPCTVYGNVVQVQQLHNGLWKYGVSILSFKEHHKEVYFNFLYDREPTLPRYISSSHHFSSFFMKNIVYRCIRHHEKHEILPRMHIHKRLTTTSNKRVVLQCFNYEFLWLRIYHYQAEEHLFLPIGENFVLDCTLEPSTTTERYGFGSYRYRVNNIKELVAHDTFYDVIKQWMK